MTYSIVYSTRTGNTGLLAETIKNALPAEGCAYIGAPCPEGGMADLVFAGFWTDKGSCSEELREFLIGLRDKQVFLFGTAGFGGAPEYFSRILTQVSQLLDSSNTVGGTYMCQGKMQQAVRSRYEAMLEQNPGDDKVLGMISNFDIALIHPDNGDLQRLALKVKELLSQSDQPGLPATDAL